jgi:hypothetical protein
MHDIVVTEMTTIEPAVERVNASTHPNAPTAAITYAHSIYALNECGMKCSRKSGSQEPLKFDAQG